MCEDVTDTEDGHLHFFYLLAFLFQGKSVCVRTCMPVCVCLHGPRVHIHTHAHTHTAANKSTPHRALPFRRAVKNTAVGYTAVA